MLSISTILISLYNLQMGHLIGPFSVDTIGVIITVLLYTPMEEVIIWD